MFSVDPHFRDVITWELMAVVIGAILAVGAILFIVRRLIPAPCCLTGNCFDKPEIKKKEGHHGSIRRLPRRSKIRDRGTRTSDYL